jgi:hypothetical protein
MLENNTGWGIASLVLAVASILFLLIPFIGIILSILSLIFSKVQKETCPTSIATAGMVIGIIGFILNSILITMFFTLDMNLAGQAVSVLKA